MDKMEYSLDKSIVMAATFTPADFLEHLAPLVRKARLVENYYTGDALMPESARGGGGQTPWRVLPVPRIHLMLAGQHRIGFLKNGGEQTVRLKPGDVWHMPANAHDHEYFETNCIFLGLVFYSAYMRMILVDYRPPKDPKFRTPYWYHWPGNAPAILEHQLGVLAALSELPDDAAIGRAAAEVFWRSAARWIAQTDFSGNTGEPQGKAHYSWIRIHHYLHDNQHLTINRETAAEALGIHSSRVYALCRKFAGKGFHDLLEEKRMERAKEYLATTGLKVESLARMCGYSGAPYFIRAFRKATGMTPGQWRLKNGV